MNKNNINNNNNNSKNNNNNNNNNSLIKQTKSQINTNRSKLDQPLNIPTDQQIESEVQQVY